MAKVLLVDDADDLRAPLEILLRRSGHRVLSVSSGGEALAALARRGPPDVAVLDLLMPGMSGFQLHGRLREDPALADVPVIFLSSRNQPGDIAAGRGLGAVYLTKPVVWSTLTEAIEQALRRTVAEQDAAAIAIGRLPAPAEQSVADGDTGAPALRLIRVLTDEQPGPGAESRQRFALSDGLISPQGWDDL